MLSGVRRKSTAEEFAKGKFQTTNLIVNHFKRDKDLEQIINLTGENNTLRRLLIASSVIHLYHYLGVKTINSLDIEVTAETSEKIELIEKKELFKEIEELASDSIEFELNLLLKALDYDEKIVSVMKERNEYDERFLNKLNNDFEEEITEIINKYPIMCVYDFIGSLVGMRDAIKTQLIEEASDFKPTSIEIEKRLTMELNVDRYIELSTLQRLYEKMQKRFEFRTVKDLKNELYPIKKITATAMDYNLNKYPISIPGLEAILDTITFKKKTYNEFVRANTEEINYEKFEKSMLKMIGDELITQLKKGTSRFIYYIQNLVDLNGQSVFDFLNTYGISDLDALVHVSKIDTVPLLKTFEALTITKNDVMVLTKKPNIFDRLEDALNTLKKKNHVVTKKNIMELIVSQKPYEIEYMKETCKMVGETYEDVIKIYNKNHLLIDQFKIQDLVGGMSRLLLLFDFESIIQNLSRVIYYSILSNVCKQISRIIEVYIKINEDKSLFLLGIKKMQEVKSENDWVKIKIEELLIKRLMRRQSELAAVFNAENNPFYVNGYMLARLTDSNLDMVINELKNEPSICYKGVSELPLPSNIISPVSYPLAFEVLSKFILNHELDKIKVSELVQQTKDAEDEKKKIVKAKQEEVTLDWIEKRIVQSMMIITREGINPSNLYWDEEKDMKLCMNAIKSHSELKNKKICPVCGVPLSTETCLEHEDTTAKEASFVDLVAQFYLFSLQKIYQLGQSKKTADFQKLREEVKEITCDTLKLRLKREPSEDDYNQTIEGERLQVAKAIAEIIGNILDKALNRKFKEKMNEKKSSR